MTYHLRSLFLTALLFTLTSISLQAQHQFGVRWNIPENQAKAVQQLQLFSESGITIIEIEEDPSRAIWQRIDSLGLNVYGNLGIKFPIPQTFANPDSAFIQSIQEQASSYLSQPSVQAIGLFEYGAINQPAFIEAVQPFINELKNPKRAQIYYTTTRDIPDDSLLTDFVIRDIYITSQNVYQDSIPDELLIGGYRYTPAKNVDDYLSPFKTFLQATDNSTQKIIFVTSEWFLSIVDKYPQFKSTLGEISEDPEAMFPLPEETLPDQQQSAIPVILLLIIWGSVALHYNTSPLYRKSLFRYFTGHKFFIEDIFQRHIRSSSTALIIIMQHILMIAACVYALFTSVWSPLGTEALLHHFPILGFFGNGPLSLFILTTLSLLIFILVCILWLYFSHKNINSLTQITTIYAWPLQVNLIVGTVVITLFASAGSNSLILAFTLLAIFISTLSFVLSAIDTAKYLKKRSRLYLFTTGGIYILLIGGIIGWAMTREAFWDIVNLSLSL